MTGNCTYTNRTPNCYRMYIILYYYTLHNTVTEFKLYNFTVRTIIIAFFFNKLILALCYQQIIFIVWKQIFLIYLSRIFVYTLAIILSSRYFTIF